MQNGGLNELSQQHERVTPDINIPICDHPILENLPNLTDPAPIASESKEDAATDPVHGPPSKRRKLAESNTSRRSTPRAASPPWKKAGVDGPTSFIQDGKRRSTRTNVLPVGLQSDHQHTGTNQRQHKSRSSSVISPKSTLSPLAVTPSSSEVSGKLNGRKVKANGSPGNMGARRSTGRRGRIPQSPKPGNTNIRSQRLIPLHASPSDANSVTGRLYQATKVSFLDGSEKTSEDEERDNGENTQKLPRLRFKVKKPSISIQHPSHGLPPRKYTSFREWLENEGGQNKDDVMRTSIDALKEARTRLRIEDAAESGGLLSPDTCSAFIPEPQEEPAQQYSHQDHLVSHALYFKKLLDQEHKRHRNTAKLCAQWCADAWRKRHKRPEDILREQQEQTRTKRRQVVKDLQKMFDLARAEIDRIRLARWEEERKMEDQQALDRAIKQSTMLFEKRRLEILGETASDIAESSEGEKAETDPSSESGDESNMSTTDLESDYSAIVDDDEALTAEELQLKYANLLGANNISDRASVTSTDTKSSGGSNTSHPKFCADGSLGSPTMVPENIKLDKVDPMLLDESDQSTDMDDDMGDSDEDEDEDSEAFSGEESDDGPGLLGFFSSNDIRLASDRYGKHAVTQDVDSASEDEDEDEDEEPEEPDEVSLVPNGPTSREDKHRDIIHATSPTIDHSSVTNGSPKPETAAANASDATGLLEDDLTSRELTVGLERPQYEDHQTTEGTVVASDEAGDDQYSINVNHDKHDDRQSGEASSEASPGTLATKPSEPESISSYEAPMEKPPPNESPAAPGLKTPIPQLLRGTLREYQHFGLDWLAGLYTNHINGILADEMGLGKTIQTIALLAHLAVEHHVWGPHLVVVPTSVILNWEMEFKKWCPGFKIMAYYGTQEERRQKRKGWMDDTSWNVLITSYQLVLQDQQVLKRRNWHYMILDEAHNIKNFRSQRWQALLTFKTRARLLLTGTPLQNNLTELWSLLFFLMPSDSDGTGIEGFADLRNFSEWFRRPVEQILEHGRETMDEEAKQVVTKLHTVLRPYILRRLKADVEKQMPAKYEHVVYCRLSKRQRYLYDGFMSRAQTKETLASGNYLSIINCLMQLRKVCNHPDLFETRPISTSFAMPKSVVTEYEVYERLIRRRLLYENPLSKLDLDFLNLAPISRENLSRRLADDSTKIMAYGPFKALRERQYNRTNWEMEFDGSTIQSTLDSLENVSRITRMQELERCLYFESKRHGRRPIYGSTLIEFLTTDSKHRAGNARSQKRSLADQLSSQSSVLASMILSIEERSRSMDGYIQRFACVTPAAVATSVTEAALTPIKSRYFTEAQRVPPYDPFHEVQMRLSIAFPDRRLLQYDCGKLQRLDKLLRDLKAGGHRALIFTQMTKMLDILEQFLNIHGHRYLRLDGTTRVEQRQLLTDRFNNDDRILAFILSTRSGGLGINLTGADTVIFYDLDWNPAMDKQCQDRCHRIGQTRDVHIYRFVSEYTIESNILRKANQKRMLDDVVIQEGEFTTDYFTKLDVHDMIDECVLEEHDEASAAIDRVLDTRGAGVSRVFEQAEDKEDRDAAKNAQRELEHADDGDFEDRSVSYGTPARIGPSQAGTPLETGPDEEDAPGARLIASPDVHGADDEVDVEPGPGHIDNYLLRFMEWLTKDEPLVLPTDKNKKSKKGKEHRVGKRRR
ncbi:swr1 complex component [Monascus purpureus]|uniref:Helicase SWR1 n=1 Tax=Monascus purpureus TaxID=5098 RepID=A0A507QPD9_MONPU|nr:swr1 complex component [Monascus purpureus]